jgi:hypothetical protein
MHEGKLWYFEAAVPLAHIMELFPSEILSRIYFFPFFKKHVYTLRFFHHKSNSEGEKGNPREATLCIFFQKARVCCTSFSYKCAFVFQFIQRHFSAA